MIEMIPRWFIWAVAGVAAITTRMTVDQGPLVCRLLSGYAPA